MVVQRNQIHKVIFQRPGMKPVTQKNGKYYVGGKALNKVKDYWKFLPSTADTIDFIN